MTDFTHRYLLGGLTFASEIELPELACDPREGEQLPAAEVSVRLGPVVPTLEGAVVRRALYQATPDRFLFELEGSARYLVTGGREILVDVAPGASEDTVRLLLLGTVLGMLYHQRGVLPLHASSVVVDGAAVAFLGVSGAGKSTLAAALTKRGHVLISDDVCPVSIDPAGKAVVLPGIPRIRLWTDALGALDIDARELCRVRPEIEKYTVTAPTGAAACDALTAASQSHVLRRIYLLSEARGGESVGVGALSPAAALSGILEHTYRARITRELGVGASHFARCAAIVREVEMRTLMRPPRLAELPMLLDLLERDLA